MRRAARAVPAAHAVSLERPARLLRQGLVWGHNHVWPLWSRRWIDNNSFRGRLPARLPCSYPLLADLRAAYNSLSGTIPATWLSSAGGVDSGWNKSLHVL